jgi:hypothetical protein
MAGGRGPAVRPAEVTDVKQKTHARNASALRGVLLLGGLLLGLLPEVVLPSAASAAESATFKDPSGDTSGPDITSVTAAYSGGTIRMSLTTLMAIDPSTNGYWRKGAAWVLWNIDTNGDSASDYDVLVTYFNDLVSEVRLADSHDPLACTARSTYSAGVLSTEIGASCVGSPSSVQVQADYSMYYYRDVAPNNGFCCLVGPPPPPPVPGPESGYWMVNSQGDVFAFGGARDYGMESTVAVDIEPTPTMNGYWILNQTGQVFAHGAAGFYGNYWVSGGERAVSLSATPTGNGYWIFTNIGRVIAFGDAHHYGEMASSRLNAPILDSVSTPSGLGYWMVASDGGIFSFGDARFFGSTGSTRLNQPVISMAPDPDGAGYWLVASDGGIFAFEAPFYGSMGAVRLNRPISGIVQGAGGYLMVAEDGGVFAFGAVDFHGSLPAMNRPTPQPVVAVALKPPTG